MSEDVKGTIHSTDIHQIEKGQHHPDPLEEVPRSGIAVLDDDRQRSENGIDDKKISCASQETPEKTSYGPKNAGAKDEQVHEHDVWRDDPYKDHGFLTAIALYGHCTKVANRTLDQEVSRAGCTKSV